MAETISTSWELKGSSIIAKRPTPGGSSYRKPGVANPSWAELKNHFATSALPMVGFGFMDNFIMIQAGGYIDSTLGVKFGLATLTAAAMGQVVSDVSGVLFGSTVDNAITRAGLLKPSQMTYAQRRLPLTQRVSLAGAVVGVITGCGLGATSLFFVPDHKQSEAEQHLDKLKEILLNMLRADDIECDECIVYLAESTLTSLGNDGHDFDGVTEISSNSDEKKIYLQSMNNNSSLSSQQCAQNGNSVVVVSNSSSSDRKTICSPIHGKNNALLGVVEFAITRRKDGAETSSFGDGEEQLARITARHIGVVLEHCF